MRIITLSIACIGVLFCAMNAMGMNSFCFFSGCAATSDFSLFGISMYWWGALAFSFFIPISFVGTNKYVSIYAAGLLFADCFFLLFMSFALPCLSCLIVACFIFSIALIQFFASRKISYIGNKVYAGIIIMWISLFSPNAFNLILEVNAPAEKTIEECQHENIDCMFEQITKDIYSGKGNVIGRLKKGRDQS